MNKESPAIWQNLYGPPMEGRGPHADLMSLFGEQLGSHYRGRVLYSIKTENQREPKTETKDLKFKFPENPQPQSEQKSYLLRVDIFEGHELPARDRAIVHVIIGPYMLCSKPAQIVNGRANWYESLEDKKCLFPKNIKEVPDLIFYFADDNIEKRRHSFIRVKAEDFLDKIDAGPIILSLKEDRSLALVGEEEFPGFLYVKIQLFSHQPPPR